MAENSSSQPIYEKMMLEDNFDEYCEQFENYLRFRKNEDFHTHKHDHEWSKFKKKAT